MSRSRRQDVTPLARLRERGGGEGKQAKATLSRPVGAPSPAGGRGEITLGALCISLMFKPVKNVHLSVHPPAGDVRLVLPLGTNLDVARSYAISKLGWIHKQQAQLAAQARETPRDFVTRESHYLWGQRYLLRLVEADSAPALTLKNGQLELRLRAGTRSEQRAAIYQRLTRRLLHEAAAPMLANWQQRLAVTLNGYFLQRMKTRWGSCNPARGHIRLNTELVKKPPQFLEYVIVHELLHLLEPSHNARFVALLDTHLPNWRDLQRGLNALPLGAD